MVSLIYVRLQRGVILSVSSDIFYLQRMLLLFGQASGMGRTNEKVDQSQMAGQKSIFEIPVNKSPKDYSVYIIWMNFQKNIIGF